MTSTGVLWAMFYIFACGVVVGLCWAMIGDAVCGPYTPEEIELSNILKELRALDHDHPDIERIRSISESHGAQYDPVSFAIELPPDFRRQTIDASWLYKLSFGLLGKKVKAEPAGIDLEILGFKRPGSPQ